MQSSRRFNALLTARLLLIVGTCNRRGNNMPMAPLSTYQDAVVDRYKSSDGTPDYERSWSYLDKILAREIGKAGPPRNTAMPARSSGVPQRPAGVRFRMRSLRPGTCRRASRVSSVSIQPGRIALTWMLSLAQAVASDFVSCTMAPLLAE